MAAANPLPAHPSAAVTSRRLRLAVLALPVCLLLLVGALFLGRWWLDNYLRGGEFRRFLDGKVSQALRADAHIEPLRWQNSEVFSEGINAKGLPGSPLGTLDAEQVHAELNLRALWNRVWRIDEIACEKLKITLPAGSAADGDPAPFFTGGAPTAESTSSWMPNRVEIGEVRVMDFSLDWPGRQGAPGGGFQQVQLIAHPGEDTGTWMLTGQGGRLVQEGLPAILLDRTNIKTTRRTVFINQVTGQVEAGGKVELSGRQDLEGDRALDLTAMLDGVPVERLLSADWRARLQGAATGRVQVTGSAADPASWRARGHLDLRDGRLEALPVLDELAVFTTSAMFRQATLQASGGDFDWSPQRLTVSKMVLESAGLLRLEGGFTVVNGQIDGTMEVGVARSAMRWLAGAGTRVFNEPERGGYVWTSVRLTGPARSPHEDLTPRLAAAIEQEAVDKAQKATGTVIDTARSLLELLPTH